MYMCVCVENLFYFLLTYKPFFFCSGGIQVPDWSCCVSERSAGEGWHLLGLQRACGQQSDGSVYRTRIQGGFQN